MRQLSDRFTAGTELADKLAQLHELDSVVLAIPRGGVFVAAAVCQKLGGHFDVLPIRKLSSPINSNLVIGALTENETTWTNEKLIYELGIDSEELNRIEEQQRAELKRDVAAFRGERPLPNVRGKTVVVIDDAIQTGASVMAALKYLRMRGAERVIVAAPFAIEAAAKRLRRAADEFVVLFETPAEADPDSFYTRKEKLSDATVLQLIKESNPAAQIETGEFQIRHAMERLNCRFEHRGDLNSLIILGDASENGHNSHQAQVLAEQLRNHHFCFLATDLLTGPEALIPKEKTQTKILGERMILAAKWARSHMKNENVPIGFLGFGQAGSAALLAAAEFGFEAFAVVSVGGVDGVGVEVLKKITAPVLLLEKNLNTDEIAASQMAKAHLLNCSLSVVADGSQPISEADILDEIADRAIHWFDDHSSQKAPIATTSQVIAPVENEIIRAAKKKAVSFIDDSGLDILVERLKDSRVVLLGESTQGTQEFYTIRRVISEDLLKNYGFSILALAGDWSDAQKICEYVWDSHGLNSQEVLGKVGQWPPWMWANEETKSLMEWMRLQNRGSDRYLVCGLDVFSTFSAMATLVERARGSEFYPALQALATSWESCSHNSQIRSNLKSVPNSFKQKSLSHLLGMACRQFESAEFNRLFGRERLAEMVERCESYYKSLMEGDEEAWCMRENQMMETLDTVLRRSGEGAKAVVWAHDLHVNDSHVSGLGERWINLGGLVRASYGVENVSLVGFGTNRGELAASSTWGGPLEIMELPPARDHAFEDYFHQVTEETGIGQFYLVFNHTADEKSFGERHRHRIIGAVYHPSDEGNQHYVRTLLNSAYDAFVFVDQTHALKSL